VNRISDTTSNDINVVWRRDAVKATLQGFSSDPVRGVGFGRTVTFALQDKQQTLTFSTSGDPHNSYVWLLAGGGLLAFLPFAALCIAFVVDTLRRLRRLEGVAKLLATWALAFWTVFMVNAFAGPVLTSSEFLLTIWALMIIPVAVSPSVGSAQSQGRWRGEPRADLIEQ
jgi:O-antigen ligase